jgi:hypothetical protein
MKKLYFAMASLFLLSAICALADNQKVPSDIGVRIRNVQLDQSRIQSQILQLQQQYTTDQATLQHDQGELDSLKKEALASAKLDPAGWDVDLEKLEFVGKPKAPEAKK